MTEPDISDEMLEILHRRARASLDRTLEGLPIELQTRMRASGKRLAERLGDGMEPEEAIFLQYKEDVGLDDAEARAMAQRCVAEREAYRRKLLD
jgi:hypothetical protein